MLKMLKKPYHQVALLLSLAWMLSGQSVWALFQNGLSGIELNSTPVETRITLKSGTQIPFRIISRSKQKIVVDLDTVDSTQPIPTDFTAAENIEQVVLKPLGNDKIRLIIRGEKLGEPVIGMSNALPTAMKKPELVFEQESGDSPQRSARITVPDDRNRQVSSSADNPIIEESAIVDSHTVKGKTNAQTSETPEATATALPDGLAMDETASTALPDAGVDFDNEAGEAASFMPDRPVMVDKKRLHEESPVSEEAPIWQGILISVWDMTTSLAKWVYANVDRSILFGVCAFAGLILLGGFCLRPFFGRRKENIFDLEDEAPSRRSGLLTRLLERITGPSRRERREEHYASVPRGYSHRASDRPVGLSGLGHGASPSAARIQPAIRQNPQAQTIVSRNQAIQQYARQAAPPVTQPVRRDKTEIDRELQRSIQMRQAISQTHTRKPFSNNAAKPAQRLDASQGLKTLQSQPPVAPARPQPTAQRPAQSLFSVAAQPSEPAKKAHPFTRPAPQPSTGTVFPKGTTRSAPAAKPANVLPPVRQNTAPGRAGAAGRGLATRPEPALPENNNEVLEFLRSVAELMEKDGRPELANGVKRSMIPRQRL